MVHIETTLKKFGKQGEKTGWVYVLIPAKVALQIKPNNKKSFRVKGKIDDISINAIAMLPMGEGDFIIPINAAMRKKLQKIQGATVVIYLEEDDDVIKLSQMLLNCLKDEPKAEKYFNSLPPSHKNYYSNWVNAAKSELVIAKRIAVIIEACAANMTYGEMMRAYRESRNIHY